MNHEQEMSLPVRSSISCILENTGGRERERGGGRSVSQCGGSMCSKQAAETHKATGIIVAYSLGIAEGFQQWV